MSPGRALSGALAQVDAARQDGGDLGELLFRGQF
jgi:hypothetical protein